MESLKQPKIQNEIDKKVALVFPKNEKNDICFDDDTFGSISKLGSVFRKIRKRMENDGYTIKSGILKNKYE
jgi:hypothetical protein